MPSWDIQVLAVGSRAPHLGLPDLVNLGGKIFLYQSRGIVFACALGSIFMVRALVPCFVVSWSIVQKAVLLSVALSVNRPSSMSRVEVMLLECRGCVGMISMLS